MAIGGAYLFTANRANPLIIIIIIIIITPLCVV